MVLEHLRVKAKQPTHAPEGQMSKITAYEVRKADI